MKRSVLISLIAILAAVLLILVIVAANMGREPAGNTDPTGSAPSTGTTPSAQTDPKPSDTLPTQPTQPTQSTPPATSDPTQPTQSEPTQPSTSAPTQPTESVPTEPTGPIGIGLYTRQELEAMATKTITYGPGRTSGGVRPPYAEDAQKLYGKYGVSFVGEDTKNIYLTFDCGYEYTATDENGNSYRVTERILDVLKEKNVKAVFFVTMPYVQQNGDIVQRMVDEGHAVGNHSATHPVMPEQTIDRMVEEVMTLHNYVLEHFGYKMTLFRPPTGAFSIQSLCTVVNLGYQNALWSFAHLDYDTSAQPSYDSAYDLITRSHHNGAIYLLHAISTTNAAVLGDCIDFFQAEGYELSLLGS